MNYQVAVIGAGPAGSVAAMILAATGHQVALIDRPMRQQKKVGESLIAAARPLLQQLFLLDLVDNHGHVAAYGNASAWGSTQWEMMDFIRDPNGLGWHLDRPSFDAALRQEAVRSGACFMTQRLGKLQATPQGWQLELGGQTLRTPWLIDASGRSAWVARQLGISRYEDDALQAIYTWVPCLPGDEETRTFVEARPEGWWYSTRLPDQTRIIALHCDPPQARQIRQQASLWLEMLCATQYLKDFAPSPDLLPPLRTAAANSSRLTQFSGQGWLACGDAAISFDPLSSQGIYNALYSGMRAGQTLIAALGNKLEALAAYDDRLHRIWAHFIARQRQVYALEERWCDQPFWQSRRLTHKIHGRHVWQSFM